MKKHLILYILILSSYTRLMGNNIYTPLEINLRTIQSVPIVQEGKRETLNPYTLKKVQGNSLSKILKYVKTKKISKEKSKIGAKINYAISKTIKLELNLSTTLHTKDLTRINLKGREARFTFSFLL